MCLDMADKEPSQATYSVEGDQKQSDLVDVVHTVKQVVCVKG